jgi:hypothetical protein
LVAGERGSIYVAMIPGRSDKLVGRMMLDEVIERAVSITGSDRASLYWRHFGT